MPGGGRAGGGLMGDVVFVCVSEFDSGVQWQKQQEKGVCVCGCVGLGIGQPCHVLAAARCR